MTPARAVALASALYAAIFFALGVDRYVTYHSGADLGLFVQTIASAFSGFSNTLEGQSHFAYHFSPVLYLCAPFVWLTHSAIALIAIQAIATSLIAPALFAIARSRVDERFAAALACTALLYPPLQGVTFTEFHETAFIPATIAWLLYAIDAKRFRLALVLVAFALCIKEDQAPAMIWLALALLAWRPTRVDPRARAFAFATIALSLAVFVGYFALVRPLAGVTEAWHPSHFYAWTASNTAIDPVQKQILGRLTYLAEAFIPLAFIPLRSPAIVLALPGFLEVLASKEPLTYTMGQHYPAVWIPYVLVAFVLGACALWSRREAAARVALRASVGICIVIELVASPLHLGHFLGPRTAHHAQIDRFVAMVPATASVGTHDEIYAHLGFVRGAAIGLATAPQYALFDDTYVSTAWDNVVKPALEREIGAGVYHPVASTDRITLYSR